MLDGKEIMESLGPFCVSWMGGKGKVIFILHFVLDK
jgi:hypothetical protein